jgi:hypothetical protein
MKGLIKTAALVVATAGLSGGSPASANISPTEDVKGARLASAPFGLSFEDLRVGLIGKVSAEVGSCKLPVRVATDGRCAI